MRIKAVPQWQIRPSDKILHKIEGIVQVTFIRPDSTGGTYFEYYDRYGLPATFRRGPFERVLKIIDQGGLF
jgi:hypothetical protein